MSSTHAHGEADRHGDDLEELDAPIVGAKRAAFLSRCRASSSAMHQHDPSSSSSSPAICAHTGSAAAATAHDDVDDAAHATLEAFLNAPESTNTVVREWYAESHHVDPAQLSCGASSSPLTSSATRPARDVLHDDDVDELEVVEVEESTAVVSGNLQRVLGNGPLEVATTFDNFFEEDGTQTHGPTEHSATTTTTPATTTNARVVRKVPSLDTILGLHEPRDDAAPSPPPTPEKMMGPAMEEDDAHGTTSIASVVLPGLEDPSSEEEEEEEDEHNHSNNNCVGARPSHSHTTAAPADFVDADVRRQLQAVAEDVDNHVQPFSMDPMFDYDADVVGSDARRGGGRRGAAEAFSHVVKKEAPREGVEDEGGEQMTPS